MRSNRVFHSSRGFHSSRKFQSNWKFNRAFAWLAAALMAAGLGIAVLPGCERTIGADQFPDFNSGSGSDNGGTSPQDVQDQQDTLDQIN